jgi:hypothetical protein
MTTVLTGVPSSANTGSTTRRQVQAPFCDAGISESTVMWPRPKMTVFCSANKHLKTYSIFLKFVANLTFSLRKRDYTD